jgi:hypothetical protein
MIIYSLLKYTFFKEQLFSIFQSLYFFVLKVNLSESSSIDHNFQIHSASLCLLTRQFNPFVFIEIPEGKVLLLPFSYLSSISLFFFFSYTGVWNQGFVFAKQALYLWARAPVHFSLVILEMGPHELFALAVLELWSSLSQPPK